MTQEALYKFLRIQPNEQLCQDAAEQTETREIPVDRFQDVKCICGRRRWRVSLLDQSWKALSNPIVSDCLGFTLAVNGYKGWRTRPRTDWWIGIRWSGRFGKPLKAIRRIETLDMCVIRIRDCGDRVCFRVPL